MGRDDEASDEDEFDFVDDDDFMLDGLHEDDLADELSDRRIEADEDLLPRSSDASAPDPGYAAYAQDLEDPLADWPAPDLKESDTAGTGPLDPAASNSAESSSVPLEAAFDDVDDELTARAEDRPVAESRDSTTADDNGGRPRPDAAPASGTDRDDDFIDDFLSGIDDPEASATDGLDEAATAAALLSPAAPQPASRSPTAPEPASSPGSPESGEADDYSASLDEVVAATTGGAAVLSGGVRGASEKRDPNSDGKKERPPERAKVEEEDHGEGGGASPTQLIPWAMVAVVVLAIVLLAVGGYGVIKERSTLESRIRELQAQLATAVSTEEIAAEREEQRRLESENQALETRLAALEAENAAMIETISSLEARSGGDDAEVPEEAGDVAAPIASTESAASSVPAGDAARSANAVMTNGPWFVNFGSYARRADADRWARRLSVTSGAVVVQSTQAGGRTLHRVRVIGLASKEGAERVAGALEQEYDLPRLWVGRN